MSCLLCGQPTALVLDGVRDTRFGAPGAWAIHRCAACGLAQTEPRPDAATLKALYERYYNFGGESESSYGRARSKLFSSALYKIWLTIDGDVSFHAEHGSGRLLDIGCNEGRGLAIYAANGFAAEGLELNANAARLARSRGFIVHECMTADLPADHSFDRVVLSNVLEHTLDPRATLRDIHGILKPGGEVWISLPNFDSWLAKIFGRAWINWHVPYHITHFTVARLTALLAECGFTVSATRQITPALWVAQSLQNAISPSLLPKRWLTAALMLGIRGGLFPLLWAMNRLGRGDCLVIKARA